MVGGEGFEPPTSRQIIVGAMPPYIGRRMRRVEDERLITGKGRFAGDVKLDDLVHVAFCRSTLPHARIEYIDTSAARAMPGVLAVWTADDLPEAWSRRPNTRRETPPTRWPRSSIPCPASEMC